MFSSCWRNNQRHSGLFLLTIFFSICLSLHAININNMQIIEEQVLTSPGELGYSAEIALHPTDGSLHVAWVSQFYEIKYRVRSYNGGWSAVNTIPDGSLDVYGAEGNSYERKCLGMCIDYRGITHIVFADKSGDVYYLYGVLGQWSNPVKIVDKDPYSIYLDIVSVWNNLYIIYEDSDQDKIYGVYRIGGSWTAPQLVTTGEYPSLTVGSNERIYFLCRGGLHEAGDLHRIKFAVLENGQTSWQFKSGMTNPEGQTGQGPAIAVANGKIFLSWAHRVDDPDPYIESRLYCAVADEPGNTWIPRLDEATTDSWDYPYYENLGNPYPNVSVYSDGLVMQMNGGRDERFRLWDGTGWTGFRRAPWNDDMGWELNKILQVVNDGRTAWIVRSSSDAFGEVGVSGITYPGGEMWNHPAPDRVQELDIVTKKALDTSGFSGDVAVNPADGTVHVTWVQSGSIKYAIRFVNGTWSSTEDLSTAGQTAYGAQGDYLRSCLALDIDATGKSHLVFSTDAGGLYYLSGQPGLWEAPVQIASHNDHLIYPDIETWFNTVSVVYESAPGQHIYSIQASCGQWQTPWMLDEGENPVLSQGSEGRLYLCYRSMNARRDLNFGSCIPTFTYWEIKSAIIQPEDQSGASPGMTVLDNEIYIAWNNDTEAEGSAYKSQLYCTISMEPGQNWITGQGSYGPIYSENTSDPHTRVSPYSDGCMLYLNGRRLESRFALYDGETWSMTRTAPWESGYPAVDTDGQTVWVMVTTIGNTAGEVSLTGIRNPDAAPFDFEHPAPQIVLPADTLKAEVGQLFQIDLSTLEQGGQSLTAFLSSVTPLLSGMDLDEATNTFSWTPQASQMTQNPWGQGAGMHLFGVTVTNMYGKSETAYFWIQVGIFPPIAAFSQDTTWGSPPLTVQFMDQSQGEVTGYVWNFGDDTESSLLQNPEHTFSETGSYSVSLKVTGPGGSDSVMVENLIQVGVPKPIAVFSADTTWGESPLAVQFTDWSQGEIDQYLWDFGDGVSSIDSNPVHIYTDEGDYSVQLTVTGPGGSDTITVLQMIHVDPATEVAAVPEIPDQFNLLPNTPNPFNPSTYISFDLPQSEQVKITVFDLRGHRIIQLKDAYCAAGHHYVVWNGLDENGQSIASGLYVIVMEAGRYRAQRKAIFMK
ncbi:PKD domain-containing protein [bacterium]